MNLDIQQKSKIWESPLKVLGGCIHFWAGGRLADRYIDSQKTFAAFRHALLS